MKQTISFAAPLLAIALAVPIQACADAAGRAPRPSMTEAPAKFNGSGVVVRYEIEPKAPSPGDSVVVRLAFDGINDAGGAAIRWTASGAIALPNGEGGMTIRPGARAEASVPVVARGNGLGYLHVFTTQGGATSATSVAVPVGPSAALASPGDLKATPAGERIISFPVK